MGTSIHAIVEYQFGPGTYFCLARWNLLRNHRFFSAIAFGDGGITDGMPFPPRGFPADLCVEGTDEFLDPESPGKLGPDLHTPGCLTYSELQIALSHDGVTPAELDGPYRAMLAAMAVLADEHGPDKVRLTFCFDG